MLSTVLHADSHREVAKFKLQLPSLAGTHSACRNIHSRPPSPCACAYFSCTKLFAMGLRTPMSGRTPSCRRRRWCRYDYFQLFTDRTHAIMQYTCLRTNAHSQNKVQLNAKIPSCFGGVTQRYLLLLAISPYRPRSLVVSYA